MSIKRTGMFCLNSTIAKADEASLAADTTITYGKDQIGAQIVTRVDNFKLSNEQAEKIKAIHEQAAAKLEEILGWE